MSFRFFLSCYIHCVNYFAFLICLVDFPGIRDLTLTWCWGLIDCGSFAGHTCTKSIELSPLPYMDYFHGLLCLEASQLLVVHQYTWLYCATDLIYNSFCVSKIIKVGLPGWYYVCEAAFLPLHHISVNDPSYIFVSLLVNENLSLGVYPVTVWCLCVLV